MQPSLTKTNIEYMYMYTREIALHVAGLGVSFTVLTRNKHLHCIYKFNIQVMVCETVVY